jgi:NAD(P)-dependent dehydrogenase (short-subunit alcohol dehydrogenase family)
MSFIATLLYSQLFVTPPYPTSDFTNQVLIVTGSNTGLGFEAVKHLIRLNAAKVILAVRTVSKGEIAVEKIVKTTKCDPSRLEVWPLDLLNFDSVKQFGARVRNMPRLDALIQNAGILTSHWDLCEGHESHITVNVIGAALLGLEVLPKLRESAKMTGRTGRLAFVGSDLQYIAKFKEKDSNKPIFDALNVKEGADMNDR